MLLLDEREQIVEYGKKIFEEKLTPGTSGNLSMYDPKQGLMAISPSGIGYFDTLPEDIVIMDLEGNIVEGNRKPSSEWALHEAMYKIKPDCRAVIHTHSMYCAVFSALQRPVRAVHYVIGDVGASAIPCAPYQTFGSKELADAAAKSIGKANSVLLANHGLLACGKNMADAYCVARNSEYCAQIEYRALCIGEPIIIPDDEMDRVMNKFKSYGQP